jgi:hypothetical protein
MADDIYEVSADHVDENLRADRMIVRVWRIRGKFVAHAKPYGSSLEFDTPAEAIHKLFSASGCTNIRIISSTVTER